MQMQFGSVQPSLVEKVAPFFKQCLELHPQQITSITLVGSALGQDFVPKKSDINSVFVLAKMDFTVIQTLAQLGKKHRKHAVAAPVLMTPDYIQSSTDVFPVEFLSFKVLHHTVLGEDPFSALELKRADLRHQCERDLKAKLIGLRQGYLATLGDARYLLQQMQGLLPAMIPVFRAFLLLQAQEPQPGFSATIEQLERTMELDLSVFRDLLAMRRGHQTPPKDQAFELFRRFYETTDQLGQICDEMDV